MQARLSYTLVKGARLRHVDVFVGPSHDLIHTSLVLTGLCALAGRGAITLRYHHARSADAWLAADPVVIVCDIHDARSTRIAIDLRDGEGISRPIIDRVDTYFKRAFHPPEFDRMPAELAGKIRPFGINFGCRSAASTTRMLLAIGGALALTGKPGLQRVKQYLSTPGPVVFEQGPDAVVEPLIAFQTRLWTEQEVAAGESEPLNRDRVTMVRALKREFGARFVGGLVPTTFARQHFPDELTPHSSRYAEYLRIKKRCLISIYTRGVEHSLAFKLAEPFAASQCLVSVPLRYGLPAPIEKDRHYLEFDTVDGCLEACHRLFSDLELARVMRRANHEYYLSEIEPATHVSRVIEQSGQI